MAASPSEVDYDIPATLTWLSTLTPPAGGWGEGGESPLRVALQWPDALLADALGVAATLRSGAKDAGLEAEVRGLVPWIVCTLKGVPSDEGSLCAWVARDGARGKHAAHSHAGRRPRSQKPFLSLPHHSLQFFIVADSTFNPAALDEVTAIDHGQADVAVHYGPASLAAPTRLPCRFVFGRRARLDPAALAAAVTAHAATLPLLTPACVLLLDQCLDWAADEVEEGLRKGGGRGGVRVVVGRARATVLDPARPLPPPAGNTASLAGLTWPLPAGTSTTACAYVWAGPAEEEEDGGGGNPALGALRLALSGAPAWASADTARPPPYLLTPGLPRAAAVASRRRYFLIHKARAASLVGILVTALGDPAVAAEAEALREAALAAGKTPYTFIIGRPTPFKLANFPEIDVFVAVADSGPGQLVGGRDWLAPVVTPHEARLAWAQPRPPAPGQEGEGEGEGGGEAGPDPLDAWDPTTYRFDEPGEARAEEPVTSSCGEGGRAAAVHFSGLSLVPRGGRAVAVGAGDGTGRHQALLAPIRSGADFLTTRRTWQGLETPATGAPAAEAVGVVAGRSGRAAGYEGEG